MKKFIASVSFSVLCILPMLFFVGCSDRVNYRGQSEPPTNLQQTATHITWEHETRASSVGIGFSFWQQYALYRNGVRTNISFGENRSRTPLEFPLGNWEEGDNIQIRALEFSAERQFLIRGFRYSESELSEPLTFTLVTEE
ncbi:MAG: hypothetical protein FWC11_01615 [Firmicutes bacterium]|nr:hypothetical protein [Bacillota bacterium]MCL2255538.1 hypothetical protein [Bacillota bacterium]